MSDNPYTFDNLSVTSHARGHSLFIIHLFLFPTLPYTLSLVVLGIEAKAFLSPSKYSTIDLHH